SPSQAPSPSPAPPRVTGLGITSFDGQAVTVDVRASTTGRVLLTARFASGPSPSALVAAPPQTIALRGATSYRMGFQQPFPSPACGTTVHRRVEVSTVPAARGGAGTSVETRTVAGPRCPKPDVSPAGPGNSPGPRESPVPAGTPGVPRTPEAPKTPDPPRTPDAPKTPEAPRTPGVPQDGPQDTPQDTPRSAAQSSPQPLETAPPTARQGAGQGASRSPESSGNAEAGEPRTGD
ncbi:hypothetical protein GSF24_35560, partial [Microbispora triticiradicis]|nr:hypothetical protein [Microbispora triticiradicis]